MKYGILCGSIAFLFFLVSCNKDNNAGLVGKWNVVTDLSYVGAGQGNHQVDYDGQSGDYFSFSSDGQLYTKENGMLDTVQYQVASNAKLTIGPFDSSETAQTYTISISSFNKLIISTGFFYTPGGTFGRTVTLDR